MRRYINIFLIALVSTMLVYTGCEEPEYPPASGENQISDINVLIPNTDAKIDPVGEAPFEDGDTIHFDVPYHFPVENDEVTDITHLKVVANIPDGAKVSPALGMKDLSEPFEIQIEAANGDVKTHVIDARLKKSSAKEILSFSFPQFGIEGIVSDSVVSYMVPLGFDTTQLNGITPQISLPPRATITPDTTEPQDFTEPVQYTVTANDGSQKVYTVKRRKPEKLDYGIGYTRKVWSKSFSELSFREHIESSVAISGDYMVVTDKWQPLKLYNKNTGESAGILDMTGFSGMCFQVDHDSQGNVIASNYAGKYGAGTFEIFKWEDVNAQPEKIISLSGVSTDIAIGRKLSIKGDVNGNAVIMAPVSFTNQIYVWYIENGQVTSSSPETYTYDNLDSWSWLCKAEPTGPNAGDPFFVIEPMTPEVGMVSGGGTITMSTDNFSWLTGDGTYFEFNDAEYLAVADIAGNYDTQFRVFDVKDQASFTKAPGDQGYDNFNVFNSDKMSVVSNNLNATCDVVTEKSDDGNSVFVYMLVTNGGMAKYELTNIDESSLQ